MRKLFVKVLILAMTINAFGRTFVLAESVPADAKIVFLGTHKIEAQVSYTAQVEATDTNEGDYVVSITPMIKPDGLSYDTLSNTWTWLPSKEQVGLHYLLVKATDSKGESSYGIYNLLVEKKNKPPVFTSDFITLLNEWLNIE